MYINHLLAILSTIKDWKNCHYFEQNIYISQLNSRWSLISIDYIRILGIGPELYIACNGGSFGGLITVFKKYVMSALASFAS